MRDRTVADLWNTSPELHFGRLRDIESLWGHCRTCYYADVCRGGCTWTADSLFGRPGNNPYCHYRDLQLEKRGLRERIRKVADAPERPFAIGRFELIEEAIPGREVLPPTPRPPPRVAVRTPLEPLPQLEICRGCSQYIWRDETTCPHCGVDVAEAAATYAEAEAKRLALMTELREVLDRLKQLNG